MGAIKNTVIIKNMHLGVLLLILFINTKIEIAKI